MFFHRQQIVCLFLPYVKIGQETYPSLNALDTEPIGLSHLHSSIVVGLLQHHRHSRIRGGHDTDARAKRQRCQGLIHSSLQARCLG